MIDDDSRQKPEPLPLLVQTSVSVTHILRCADISSEVSELVTMEMKRERRKDFYRD